MNEGKKTHDAASIASAIRNFSQSLAALRDFVDFVNPVLQRHADDEANLHSRTLLPLVVAFSRLGLTPELTPDEEERIRRSYGAEFEVVPASEAEGTEQRGERFEIKVASEKRNEFASTAIRVLGNIERRVSLLYGSSLVSLLSSAEWFVSQLLHVHFRLQPGTLGLRDKVYSLEDLQAFDTVEDARAHLIDSRIESTLRGSVEEWLDNFKTKVGLSMGYVDDVKSELVELGQRRNLVVHNGGIVNSIYLAKVSSKHRQRVRLGDKIPIDRGYLDAAIALVERTFILVGAELWKKLEPATQARGTLLNRLAFDHLLARRWKVAESLTYFTRGDKMLPEHDRLIATINYWQSLKWQDRFGEVQSEIGTADFSAKDEVFQVARLVLLDDFASVVGQLPLLFDHKKLGADELATWPLFRKFRETPEYQAFCEKTGGALATDVAQSDA